MMVMLLRRLGYEIRIACNGLEALQLLEREAIKGESHEVQCIIMDASMDGPIQHTRAGRGRWCTPLPL